MHPESSTLSSASSQRKTIEHIDKNERSVTMKVKLCSRFLIRVVLVVLALLGQGGVRLQPFAHKQFSLQIP